MKSNQYLSLIPFLLLLLHLAPGNLSAQKEPGLQLWGQLEPGSHQVGYTTINVYDFSRSFGPQHDYQGQALPANRARPVMLSIWYPANPQGVPFHMRYEEYLHNLDNETEFALMDEAVQTRGIQKWVNQYQLGADQQPIIEALLRRQTLAIKGAPAEPGLFPLIVYAPSINSSPYENNILCEYLASHGYIIASAPSTGAYTGEMNATWEDLEAQTRDVEFILSSLRKYPGVNTEQIGALGFSWGGVAVSLLVTRNFNVDAVISLDGSSGFGFGGNSWEQYPYYNPRRVRAPLMMMVGQNYKAGETWEFYQGVKYADSYLLRFKKFDHGKFAASANLVLLYKLLAMSNQLETGGAMHTFYDEGVNLTDTNFDRYMDEINNLATGYEGICRYTLNFFDTYLKGESESLEFLHASPRANGIPRRMLAVESREALPAPPSQAEFLQLINVEGSAVAVRLFQEFRERDPEVKIFGSGPMNRVGYYFLEADRLADAIEMFKLNVAAYPDDPNSFDSLGEAYEKAENIIAAKEYYEQAVQLATALNHPLLATFKKNLKGIQRKAK